MTRHIKEIGRVKVEVDPRYRFLVRVHGMLVKIKGTIPWRDGSFFKAQLGNKAIDNFMIDGVIPSPWSDMFGKYSEWERILRSFYGDFVVSEEYKDKSLMEIEMSEGNATQTQKYISRNQNSIVLNALLIKGGLGDDIRLAEVFGVEKKQIGYWRKGRDLISKEQLREVIKKLNLSEEDFQKWL